MRRLQVKMALTKSKFYEEVVSHKSNVLTSDFRLSNKYIMHANYLQHVPFEGLGSIEVWLESAGYSISCTRENRVREQYIANIRNKCSLTLFF